jgi:hypothetical protein
MFQLVKIGKTTFLINEIFAKPLPKFKSKYVSLKMLDIKFFINYFDFSFNFPCQKNKKNISKSRHLKLSDSDIDPNQLSTSKPRKVISLEVIKNNNSNNNNNNNNSNCNNNNNRQIQTREFFFGGKNERKFELKKKTGKIKIEVGVNNLPDVPACSDLFSLLEL